MRHFTPEDDAYLKANFLTMSKNSMGKKINRSIASVVCRMRVLKLEVPEDISKKFKESGLFTKGDKRLRRGKRDGVKPNTISLWLSRGGKLYYWIKTEKAWVPLHVHLWKVAGYVKPSGYIVVFKNNNSLKCTLDNLECVTRAESLARNKLINWTNKRSKRKLPARRAWKYNTAKPGLIERRKKINSKNQAKQLKLDAELKGKEQRTIQRQKKQKQKIQLAEQARIKLQQQKKLATVKMKDEISWSKKILSHRKIIIPDTSKLIPLRIDRKTILYIKPGADVEAILKMYQKKAS
jgi:hypothetical protein